MFFSDLEIDVEMWRSDIPFLEGCDNYSRAHVEPSRLTFDVPDSAIDDNGKQIILISIKILLKKKKKKVLMGAFRKH